MRYKLPPIKLERLGNMRRSINHYLSKSPVARSSGKPLSEAADSVEALVFAARELRNDIKMAECTEQKMLMHTQLDRLERQLLKQLASHVGVKRL